MGVIAITGARGFLGRATVAAALARGHDVIALSRGKGAPLPDQVADIPLDLADPTAPLSDVLHSCDAVIHTAAAMSGDPILWQRDTIKATSNLLTALSKLSPKPRLVLVSSIAVYDATATQITETTPLEPYPDARDGYTRSKLAQEALLANYAGEVWIARPGAIYGPGRLWNAHIGLHLGPLLLRLGNRGEIPLAGIAPTAQALVTMAETAPEQSPRAVNLVDTDLPDRPRFLAALGPAAPRMTVPLSWRVLMPLARLAARIPGLAPRLPGLLQPRTLAFRMAPKSFPAARAQAELDWPSTHFETALQTAQEGPA
ncbi:NAD-dependent epimerase/dehydratase family protein [Rhodalgimonas zhirmunskyi]|uniref:NAD(P)-dependent oxidoreductase n=1 Tax=Rhodalgimonas zhirmunskyi TaxID=2964767 RepID=A0AAJ1X686_9RHOB|nr:NAD(P)-dependent oxidoreductase [Rhodoalgimonas zhirmunskyi]MDQ2093157.1 NAD(P)-dependent oxidoreductase [Rhodoalgimonas zhirmunskyi]